jgi:hypothetical protein
MFLRLIIGTPLLGSGDGGRPEVTLVPSAEPQAHPIPCLSDRRSPGGPSDQL